MSEAADTAAVLFANDAFYVAFQTADADAMERVWARRDNVSCLHPGWPPLIGRQMVIQSWRGILGNADQPPVTAHAAHAELHGEVAVVICYETVAGHTLIATNVFAREDGQWRMVHHQSGETPPPPDGMPDEEERRLQ
jgi:ketosteroid isomerase-like protein